VNDESNTLKLRSLFEIRLNEFRRVCNNVQYSTVTNASAFVDSYS